MNKDEKELQTFAEQVVSLASRLLNDKHIYYVYVCNSDVDNNESLAITFGNSCPACCLQAMNELKMLHWFNDKVSKVTTH